MKSYFSKILIWFCMTFSVAYGSVLLREWKTLENNYCSLKYRNAVSEKPDIFVITDGYVRDSNICRIQSNETASDSNYGTLNVKIHVNHYFNDSEEGNDYQFGKQTSFHGLNFDDETKTLLYVSNEMKPVTEAKLVRKRLNQSEVSDAFILQGLCQKHPKKNMQDDYTTGMGYDWLTGNAYVSTSNTIFVVNIRKSWEPAVIVSSELNILNVVIHPTAGYLFYVEGIQASNHIDPTFTSTIYRTYLDGTNQKKIGPTVMYDQTFIANLIIDFDLDRLFWSLPGKRLIQTSNLNGGDVRTLGGREVYAGKFGVPTKLISFDEQYLYYVEEESRSIRRFDKDDLREDEDFEIVNQVDSKIVELVVYDSEAHEIEDDHPCLVKDNGCEKYCFLLPEVLENEPMRSCGCSMGEELDGLTCVKKGFEVTNDIDGVRVSNCSMYGKNVSSTTP